MALRMPKKLAKKSLNRDSSGGENDPLSSPPSTPSMARKFAIKRNPSDAAKKSSSSEHNAGGSSLLADFNSSRDMNNNATRGGGEGGGGGVKPTNRSGMNQQQQPFETSEGAMRLNRILDSSSGMSNSAPVGSSSPMRSHMDKRSSLSTSDTMKSGGIRKGASQIISSSSPGASTATPNTNAINNMNANSAAKSKKLADYIPPSTIQLTDPTDEMAVGEMTCRISSKMRVDVRSIGGKMLSGEGKVEARTGNVLLREGWEELLENKQDGATAAKDNDDEKIDRKMKNPLPTTMRPMNRLTNECLFQCASPNSISP